MSTVVSTYNMLDIRMLCEFFYTFYKFVQLPIIMWAIPDHAEPNFIQYTNQIHSLRADLGDALAYILRVTSYESIKALRQHCQNHEDNVNIYNKVNRLAAGK